MIEIIDGTWSANEVKTFHINGEYVELLDAQYPCDVYLMDRAGAQLSLMKKCEVSFFARPKEGFQTVQIQSAQAQYIRMFVGSGDAGTRRISSTVQVIDGGRARTIGGQAFAGVGGSSNVASRFNGSALFNPANSGVRAVVKAATVQANVAVAVGVCSLVTNPYGAAAQYGYSKMIGGAAAKTRFHTGDSAAQLITAIGYLDYFRFAGAGNAIKVYQEPLVLMPGTGILFEADAVGVAFNESVEWTEESL